MAGSTVERQEWTTEMLAKIKGVKLSDLAGYSGRVPLCECLRCPKHLTFTFTSAVPKRWRLTPQVSG